VRRTTPHAALLDVLLERRFINGIADIQSSKERIEDALVEGKGSGRVADFNQRQGT
jgi:hypothetical protein